MYASDTPVMVGVRMCGVPVVLEHRVARQRIWLPTVAPKTEHSCVASSGQAVAGCQVTPLSFEASQVTVPSL